ncbi:chromosome segregation protein SMC [Eubacterium nodatum ATCC 33099]|nr:chromosome segregation protein SMC [Eubacterium nodatum ATCC 33099]
MYFKRLEMHGFKSFAEPVIIDFHEGITCIVGPNGSGKSNISDAVRWVLGEQSPKALRGGKMEEVIFNGTESRRPRGMAEVTLVIDNSTGILDIEYKEVAITRRMFRSGESEYLINDNPCRLKDIRELIMDTGIGVDGYSIIGQGKISDIVSNKPESRREIFEEAAGIVAYKTRKQETERKLIGTKNNLERIDDIVGEIEGRIGGLKEDSIKAKRYLELKEHYKDLEINIILRNIESTLHKNNEYSGDISELGNKLDSINRQRKQADESFQELQKRNGVLEELSSDLNRKLIENKDKMNSISSESRLNHEKLLHLRKEEERLSGEVSNFAELIAAGEKELEHLRVELTEIDENLAAAEKRLQEKIYLYDSVTGESSKFSDIIDENNEKIISLNSEAASKKSEAKSYKSYQYTLEDRKEKLQTELEKLKENQTKSTFDLGEKKKEIERLQGLQNEIKEKIQSQLENRQKLEQEELYFRRKLEELKISQSRTETRLHTIEEMEQNFEGYNYAVKYIMRCGISGIEGVVGEMINVPEGYETAVETALGAAMQNIVVADDDCAKKAITALKVSQSGRLTFLPVGSINSKKAVLDGSITSDHGFCGIGSELIDFEPRYKKIFDYLLGRVVIVKDLNSAILLSKRGSNGVRFVTLDGEVINSGGAITGGRYKNKSANLLERKNEISKLKNLLHSQEIGIDETSKKLNEKKDALSEMIRISKEDVERIRKCEISIARVKDGITYLENVIADIKLNAEKNEKEIIQIDRDLSEMSDVILKFDEESRAAQSEIEKIGKEMDEILQKHQKNKKAIEFANQGITEARIDVNLWEEKRNNLNGNIEKNKEAVERLRVRSEEQVDKLSDIREDKGKLEQGTGGSNMQLERLKVKLLELQEDIEKVSLEKSEVGVKLGELGNEITRTDRESNLYRDQKYQLEIKKAKNDTQLDNMKDKLWNEFEISYAQAGDLRKEEFAMSSAVKESREIRKELKEIGDVNVGAIEEYKQVSKRYEFLTEQREDILKAMEELEDLVNNLDKTIMRSFKENFNKVEENFENVFEELFGGGYAELRMENENNPLESGIEIVAQPPGKKLQNINLMSGGEKTMTAIALMFAVLKTKPTPFCILDEIEAALDDKNIDKFSHYLRKFAETQFALITHQKATMEHADVLYGITMPERGISKVLSLRMGDYDPDEYTS